MINTKKIFLRGISWNSAAQLYRQGWTFLVLIILARLLNPKDFGLIGMTTVFIQFFNMFLTMGFESSIIQSEELSHNSISSLFWLNIIMGILLVFIAVIFSPLVSLFYNIKELSSIFSVLSLSFIFGSFSIVPRGLLTKKFHFKAITLVDSVSATLSGISAVIMAVLGFGYWSLVFKQVSFSFFSSVGYWYSLKWRPKLHFNFGEIKHHLNFSINVFIFNILNFVSRRSDVLVIGKFLGAEQLGFYMMAYDIIVRPLSQIMGIFSKTVFPIFAEHQKDLKKFQNIYIHVTYIMLIIIAPILIFSAIIAPVLLPNLLGTKWINAVNIFQIIAIGSVFTVLGSPVGNIFLAKGRPDLQWKFSLFFATPLALTGIGLGYYLGNSAFGVAVGYNIALAIILIPGYLLAFPLIDLKLRSFYNEIRKSIFALFLMCIAALPFYLMLINIIHGARIIAYTLLLLPIITYLYFLHKYEKEQISIYKNEIVIGTKELYIKLQNKMKTYL